jgi:membrane fusion protein (multidrug efflux system)
MTTPAADPVARGAVPRDLMSGPPAATAARWPASRKAWALMGFGVLLGLGAAWYGMTWWTFGRFVQTTDDAYIGGDVTPIAPHVAGFVQQVLVTDNQYVRAGQSLIRLDARDVQAARDHAQAVLAERQAALDNLQAQYRLQRAVLSQAQADLAADRASAVFAGQDSSRYQSLADTQAGSRQDAQRAFTGVERASAAVAAAEARLAAASDQFAVLDAQIVGATARIAQAEADLHTARLNLGYTDIASPVAGYVGDRYAEVGAYVAVGIELLSIVPASGLWVDANFKEDQLSRIRPGDAATVIADILPGKAITGHVVSLAPATGAVFSVIPPQNATGNFTKIVQRVPVRIALDGNAGILGLLRPGLSTTVSVHTRPGAGGAP